MMGHKIWFFGETWLIIPKLSLLPLLIWSTDTTLSSLTGTAVFAQTGSHPMLGKHLLLKKPNSLKSTVIRWSFFSFQNNPQNLDPSCKMDLAFWDCLERV